MILCDLPYAVTQNDWDSLVPMTPLWEQYGRIIKPNGAIVLTAQQPFSSMLVTAQPKMFRYSLVWEKAKPTGFLNAKRQPLRCHEDILVFYRKPPTYNPQMTTGHKPYRSMTGSNTSNYGSFRSIETVNNGERYPRSVQRFPHDHGSLHPTQKPVALMEWLIRTYTNPGEIVLDNCAGSGTTAVAAINSARQWIAMERDASYAAIARDRIAAAGSDRPTTAEDRA